MRKSQLYSIAFGFSLLVLLFFSLLLYNSINSLRENSSLVEHSQVVIDRLQNLELAMMDVETSQRGYLLTEDTSFLDLLKISRNKIPVLLDTLTNLVRDNKQQSDNAKELRRTLVARLERVQEVLNRVKLFSGPALNLELKDGKKMMDEFRVQIGFMQLQEQALMKNRARSKEVYERLTPNYFKAILSVTTIIAFISFILLLQELKQRLSAQAQLETRVNILAQANAELQQIAHVTSHDLQEPLRKIRTFIDAVLSKFKTEIPGEAKAMLERVDKNANYIRELVADLSDFASLASKEEEKHADIDINRILLDIQRVFAPQILRQRAHITIAPLPKVTGYEKQLTILFKELFSNSLKFSKEHLPLELTVTGSLMSGRQLPKEMKSGERNFNVISLYDNGIGFEKEYAHKIFILFQKLHGANSPYPGKGIGLAICQRIMANHDGFISAAGEEGIGATFQLYFPVD